MIASFPFPATLAVRLPGLVTHLAAVHVHVPLAMLKVLLIFYVCLLNVSSAEEELGVGDDIDVTLDTSSLFTTDTLNLNADTELAFQFDSGSPSSSTSDSSPSSSTSDSSPSSSTSDSSPSSSSSGLLRPGRYGYRLAVHLMPVHSGSLIRQTRSSTLSDVCVDREPTCRGQSVKSYRTSDGSCNNLRRRTWGQSGLPYLRFLPRNRAFGFRCRNVLSSVPNARDLSRLVIERSEQDVRRDLSLYVMVWGQVVDHDLELTPPRSASNTKGQSEFPDCCSPRQAHNDDCCPIEAPVDDFFFGRSNRPRCMPMIRSRLAGPKCFHNERDVENANTAYLDASFVYGSSESRMNELRLRVNGLMKIDRDRNGREYPFEKDGGMQFGDSRSDVHPAFTLISTVFVRNHNRLARQLKARHPAWNDERLFQEARKINSAIVQHITYTKFMETLLGSKNDVAIRQNNNHVYEQVYQPNIDPTISMAFSTAAFRLHTLVSGHFECRSVNYRLKKRMRLRDVFHNTKALKNESNFDDLARGLSAQPLQDFNNVYSPEMTEWLFPEEGDDFGLDIVTLNIQRGRDHQLQPYAKYREQCKLGRVRTWSDLTRFIPSQHVSQLSRVYKSPMEVDMYVAGNMERHLDDSLLGPTFHCLVSEQFDRIKRGDRFFYTNRGQFNARQLSSIKRMSLARVICDNADDKERLRLPLNVFKRPNQQKNPIVSCRDHSKMPRLDIDAWGYRKNHVTNGKRKKTFGTKSNNFRSNKVFGSNKNFRGGKSGTNTNKKRFEINILKRRQPQHYNSFPSKLYY